MAPIKFEDNIKDKLENRRLKPSIDAWDKLTEQLDHQEKNKNSKPAWWLGIAASLIGVLLIVTQFTNKVETIKPVIVDAPEKIEKNKIEPFIIKEEQQSQKQSVDEKILNNSEYKKILKEKTAIHLMKANQPKTVVAINETNQEENDITHNKPVGIIKEALSFEEQKIQDILTKIHTMKENKLVVTDSTIDALLFEAQKDIKLNKIINKTSRLVDANALLQDVEADLDQSFRSKVFEAIKSSYNSVKTAVAQRNK